MPNTKPKKMTFRDIAKKYNVTEATAKYWVSRKFTPHEMEKRRQRNKGPNQRNPKHYFIEEVPIEELHKKYGFTMSTLVTFAQKGVTLRQIEVKYQRRIGIPNHQKTYCGKSFVELAYTLGVSLSSVSKMAADGILIEDMPAYVEEHKLEMKTDDDKPQKDNSCTSLSRAEMKSLYIVERNRKLLAQRI